MSGPPAPSRLVLVTAGPEETRSVGRALARRCVPGDVLLLAGGLGAGKTTFAQGLGAGLGVEGPVTSPTFTLVRQYAVVPVPGRPPVRTFLHADVYRLDHLGEIADLGLGELVEDGGVALVEWGDVAAPLLGAGSLSVRLDPVEDAEDRRVVSVEASADSWRDRWEGLAGDLAPWRLAA